MRHPPGEYRLRVPRKRLSRNEQNRDAREAARRLGRRVPVAPTPPRF